MKKETMKEMFDRFMADPKITESEMFKNNEKFGEAMLRLSAAIVQPCLDYAEQHHEDDEGWSHTILIALARATCKLTYAFQKVSENDGKDVFDHYMELLPLCKDIAYAESDVQVKMKEAIEKAEEDGVPFDTKEQLIIALADPNKTPEEIVAQFFKKDLTPEERQYIIDKIVMIRRERADTLKRLHDHTDENGNYKR